MKRGIRARLRGRKRCEAAWDGWSDAEVGKSGGGKAVDVCDDVLNLNAVRRLFC